jgi:GNAT superfamily N-acetyltransferase
MSLVRKWSERMLTTLSETHSEHNASREDDGRVGTSVPRALRTRSRAFERCDTPYVTSLLDAPLAMYPSGRDWLRRRLGDVLAARARCTVAVRPSAIVGAVIETPKGPGVVKVSTLFVHPNARGCGVGKQLLSRCVWRWQHEGIQQAHITVPSHRVNEMRRILFGQRFAFLTVESDRYGPGRDEHVYVWRRANVPCDHLVAPFRVRDSDL